MSIGIAVARVPKVMSPEYSVGNARKSVLRAWRNGRRARLRIWSRKGWEFKSPRAHHAGGSFRRHHHVIAFAFAEQQMFAEEQIVRGDQALDLALPNIIQVNAAAFQIFAGLALARTKTGVDQQFD